MRDMTQQIPREQTSKLEVAFEIQTAIGQDDIRHCPQVEEPSRLQREAVRL
jgi:hypothetical protein